VLTFDQGLWIQLGLQHQTRLMGPKQAK
jgi:hypothetical protein